jgi:hypothetical protein
MRTFHHLAENAVACGAAALELRGFKFNLTVAVLALTF